ncbi:hypothetical protein E4U17_002410 [Claviceps sp. LM77 group G4]|nr:hypothetical protein E4U17_002410 [Claviceps sp. LM77 group G4]KAG6077770.1 hypothetical protein E4U33_001082 [Claviceps sp. LM78 group G4]KAG6083183.1 hypothetical protein E4U16_004778 [Claviceps sp. LM84 group G4]
MPMLQDGLENKNRHSGRPDRPGRPQLPARARRIEKPKKDSSMLRRLSEVSLPAELCDGPVSDSPSRPPTPKPEDDAATSCRAELIERLKRGESPTWIPSRHLGSLSQVGDGSPGLRTLPEPPRLLHSVQVASDKVDKRIPTPVEDRLREGREIERPRSALHSGDFTNSREEEKRRAVRASEGLVSRLGSELSWAGTSSPRDLTQFRFERKNSPPGETASFQSIPVSPLSSSYSSHFAYFPPTSPLVQSESNDEVAFGMGASAVGDLSSREFDRRLQAIDPFDSTPFAPPSYQAVAGSPQFPLARHYREPYQAHQPRRSLTTTPSFSLSGTPTHQSPSLFRTRRPSLGSDSSPMQHASMVGSYEESILRGRMSTNPSKPFDFLAQIGVLGRGSCKSSMRCPAHVTLSFPAVYYSYSSTSHSRSSSNDGPSPYVGQIDLENGLPNLEEESRSKRKAHGRYMDQKSREHHDEALKPDSDLDDRSRTPSRAKRRMGSPRAPPGGSYRIPEIGQIQIIIKNQNKTAVKLFLLPYDLTGMPPGTKTFVRQRSYSAGPIIDNLPKPRENDAQSGSRPMLRYLVHLHICCPSKGRFYLYKSIRVVFANRVPDGKEKLRNETTWPEPRFTPYKPIRLMVPPPATSGPGAMLALDNAFRRRSLGVPFGAASSRALDMADGFDSTMFVSGAGNTLPVDPIPLRMLSQGPPRESEGSDSVDVGSSDSLQDIASRPSSRDSTFMGVNSGMLPPSTYEKLNKEDLGYGGSAFATHFTATSNGLGVTEGLLSQRLRSLDVSKPPPPPPGSAKDFA